MRDCHGTHGLHNVCTIPDSGFRIPDFGFRIPDSGFRIPDSGFRDPDSGFWIPDSGFRMLDSGIRIRNPDSGFRVPWGPYQTDRGFLLRFDLVWKFTDVCDPADTAAHSADAWPSEREASFEI